MLIGGAIVALLQPVHPELVPVALAAVILSALFDRRISIIAAMVLATLVAGQSVFRGTNALFINLVGGAVAAVTVGEIRRRNQTYRWILVDRRRVPRDGGGHRADARPSVARDR